MHSIAFGPIVDGVIVPDQSLKDVMATRFKKFDIMVGIAQSESLHMFPADIGKHYLKKPKKFFELKLMFALVKGRYSY